jgi:TonB family protein
MTQFLVSVFLCLTLSVPEVCAREKTPAQNTDKFLKQAITLHANSKYTKALSVLEQAGKCDARSARLMYLRGLIHFHNGQPKDAITDLSEAIRIQPDYADAYVIRALAYEENDEPQKAIDDLEYVLKDQPTFRELLEHKAAMLEKIEKKEEAKTLKAQAEKLAKRPFMAEGEPSQAKFTQYMAQLQADIKSRWHPPRMGKFNRVVVVFKIHRDGSVTHLRLDKASELEGSNASALKAVSELPKAKPLPPGAPKDVDIQFTFDYNVFRGGGGYQGLAAVDSATDAYIGKQFIKHAQRAEAEQKHEKAATLYEKALRCSSQVERLELFDNITRCYVASAAQLKEPKGQLKQLHKALYYRPNDDSALRALQQSIKALSKDPESFDDRMALAEEAKKSGDLHGAVVEYILALRIKDDPIIQQKLDEIKKEKEQSEPKQAEPGKKERPERIPMRPMQF